VFFPAFPQNTDQALTLDQAIAAAATAFTEQIPTGSLIAVLGFKFDSPVLADYVIEELAGQIVGVRDSFVVDRRKMENEELARRIVSTRGLFVVDRRKVEKELSGWDLNFQLSGELGDETAQAIGRELNARFAVSSEGV
jgi:hypothetical protein